MLDGYIGDLMVFNGISIGFSGDFMVKNDDFWISGDFLGYIINLIACDR